MAFLTWDRESLSVGVNDMDDEHRKLIDLMNILAESVQRKEPFIALRGRVAQLVAYTRKHFADEEAYMAKIAFPGLAVHKRIHERLLEQLGELSAKAEKAQAYGDDLLVFLKTWLTAHIRGVDRQYSGMTQGILAAR